MTENLKKDQILQACLDEFSEYGYEKANTNRICEKAGVSKGLLFHYYGSKEKLFLTTVETYIDDVLLRFRDIRFDDLDFIESLLAYSKVKSDYFSQNPQYYKLILQAFYHPPKELKEALSHKYQELSKIGYQMVDDLMDKIELKQGVSRDHAMAVIGAVSNFIESKYMVQILDASIYTEDLLEQIRDEYIQLIKLVLYGIAA